MNKTIIKHYKAFRKANMGGIVGEDAKSCLRSARILTAWKMQESDGAVKIEYKEETDNYWDVYGKPDNETERKQIESSIKKYGCYIVLTSFRCPCCGQWKMSDNIGMVIDPEPLSPFSNPYVIDLMKSTLDAYMTHVMNYVEKALPQ